MNHTLFKQLLQRYRRGEASPEEIAFIESYYLAFDINPDILEHLSEEEQTKLESLLYQDLQEKIATERPHRSVYFFKMAWFRYAAAIIIIFGSITYLWTTNRKKEQDHTASTAITPHPDIAPGSNKAILTLGDGTQVVVDNEANGKLAEQGNATIVKLANGKIVYNIAGTAGHEGRAANMMNTMSTPRGGQYQLVLPDGSKVWLNAASSITYPAIFTGTERRVKITGEVYLEVEKDQHRPFIVDADGKTSIEVLGTKFDVNSYSNEESVKATLLEGSVKVVAKDNSVVIKPGQQARVAQNDRGLKVINDVNVEQIAAWRNGFFTIQDASLHEVARQLERWYDIQIKYEGVLPDKNFEGELGRNVRLSTVLNWFSDLGIHNKLEGRVVTLSGQ